MHYAALLQRSYLAPQHMWGGGKAKWVPVAQPACRQTHPRNAEPIGFCCKYDRKGTQQ